MDTTAKETIAQKVRDGRQAKGYTQQELSNLTGISLRSIQRIESADVLPRAYTVKVLSEQLNFIWDFAQAEEGSSQEFSHNPAKEPTFIALPTRLNYAQKIILTFSSGIILLLLAAAFLAQSARFPETEFELFLFIAGMLGIYTMVLLRIWK
ncbi:helix-turn-helix transcriptional regulator [Xanthocytophaga agilis]|uniref:Helix-turn-helix transcriptional regulator n=1 Tax=Xanthocytophaga agilis TaxID=3048010 RepID=A0AAE3R4P3_9BACT|nr:helix-turn-helix transcriptional regulator [Xanthocytophaga agilis]MDJ1503714.1 helix-turn-helix transcriptional regulator [Xanthocytophaga agilis]